jgi:ceramide glucosyltransferase
LQFVINQARHGSSGKVINLINMMPIARYDYLVVADSDIRVTPDYLAKVVPPLVGTDVGIVTCAYRGRSRLESWSILESAFINDWFMPSVYVAAMLGSRAFAFGATIALRREVLARIGGFGPIADQLADDYRLGELTRRIGLRTILSDAVVDTSVYERSFGDLVRHQLRWLRTIRAVRPGGYALSFMTLGLAPAAFGAWAAAGARVALVMLTITALARLMLHFASRDARSALLELWVVPVGDLLVFALWCWGFFTSRVLAQCFTKSVGRLAASDRSARVSPASGTIAAAAGLVEDCR